MSGTTEKSEDDLLTERVGSFLREARERGGMSQTRLAVMIGAKQATISKIEHGKVLVTVAMAAAYLRALGLTLTLTIEPASMPPRETYSLTV
jgi:ribosome-binding protein aMBF1 (putative translation factor)